MRNFFFPVKDDNVKDGEWLRMGWIGRAVATLARWGDQWRGYSNRISVISSAGAEYVKAVE